MSRIWRAVNSTISSCRLETPLMPVVALCHHCSCSRKPCAMKLNGHFCQSAAREAMVLRQRLDTGRGGGALGRIAASVIFKAQSLAHRLVGKLQAFAGRDGKMDRPIGISLEQRRRRQTAGQARDPGMQRPIGEVGERGQQCRIGAVRLRRAGDTIGHRWLKSGRLSGTSSPALTVSPPPCSATTALFSIVIFPRAVPAYRS